MTNHDKFIPSKFGSSTAIGGPDTPMSPSGFRYLAGPECVRWAGGSPRHADDITSIFLGDVELPVVARTSWTKETSSWTRPDGAGGTERVTIHAGTIHRLMFRAPNGTPIEYEDNTSRRVTIEPA